MELREFIKAPMQGDKVKVYRKSGELFGFGNVIGIQTQKRTRWETIKNSKGKTLKIIQLDNKGRPIIKERNDGTKRQLYKYIRRPVRYLREVAVLIPSNATDNLDDIDFFLDKNVVRFIPGERTLSISLK